MRRFADQYQFLVIGVLVSILVGLVMVWTGQDQISSWTVGLLLSLFALCFDLLKNSKSIEAQLQQLLGISEDTNLFETIRSLIIAYKQVCLVIRDVIFIERAVSILEDCRSEMIELAKGHFTVRMQDNLSTVSMLVIPYAKENVKAVSYADFEKWWRSESSRKYLQKNQNLISRGIKITRIFIVPESKIESFHDIVETQQQVGVDVLLAFEENLEPHLLDSYAMVDDRIVSRSGPAMIGVFGGTYITVEPTAVRKFSEHFKLIQEHAHKPSTFAGFFDDSQTKN
jgi:hypothetical protein